jgi:ribosomal protein S21
MRNTSRDFRKDFNKKQRERRPETFDMIFRKFKKKAERDGTVKEVRDRRYFIKPSEKKNVINNQLKRRKKLNKLKAKTSYRRR